MEKRYDIKDKSGITYFVLVKETDKGDLWELYSGQDSGWITKEKLLASLLDDGNGLKFKVNDEEKKVNFKYFGYDHAEYIRILLNLQSSLGHYPLKYEVMTTQFMI